MKGKISILVIILSFLINFTVFGQTETNRLSSMPGAFSRLGFGARGMAMGNALGAVVQGNKVAYYNPALGSFQDENSFQTGYSVLSLDRSLNFLSFTRNFKLGVKTNPDGSKTEPKGVAGVSAGIINSGVSGIDARDNQGIKFDELSTSENQFFIAVSNKFSDNLAIGVRFNFYYYSLYEEVSATAIGFDIGALYILNENLSLSLVLQNLNAQYKWDTAPAYGQQGSNYAEKFPTLFKIGAAYHFDNPNLLVAMEFENSNGGTQYLRGGIEYELVKSLLLRGGVDKFNLSNTDEPVRPSLGFSYSYLMSSFLFGLDYAFVMEPYSPYSSHVIGLFFNF